MSSAAGELERGPYAMRDATGRVLAYRDTLAELAPIAVAYRRSGSAVHATAPDGSAATIPEWIRPAPLPAPIAAELAAASAALDRADAAARRAELELDRARSSYRRALERARAARQ